MQKEKIINYMRNRWLWILVIFILLLYFLFPVQTSSVDAYGYANYIISGEGLFSSHHLLYSFLGFFWVRLVGFIGAEDALAGMKALNALFSGLSLVIIYKTFSVQGFSQSKSLAWIAFVGSSWGVMRFATENETYIVPIFLSLVGSLFLLRYYQGHRIKSILLSGLFTALACLFHQIHFFWWLAFAVALLVKDGFKRAAIFVLPAFIVPLVYLLVIGLENGGIPSQGDVFRFVFRDYMVGTASVGFSLMSVVMSGISLIRTFIQVHGYMLMLVKANLWLLGFVALALLLGFQSIRHLRGTSIDFKILGSGFILAHLLALFFQLFFAFLSHGNSEFMVMLPVLFAIVLSGISKKDTRLIGYAALGMFVWNLSFGLMPLHLMPLDGSRIVVNQIISNQSSFAWVFNKPHIENQVEYVSNKKTNCIEGFVGVDKDHFYGKTDSLLSMGVSVYTDCYKRPKTLSRENIFFNANAELFNNYCLVVVDSCSSLTGTYYLTRIIMKENSLPQKTLYP